MRIVRGKIKALVKKRGELSDNVDNNFLGLNIK